MINKAIYPGSFDPITLGHIDIIKRAKNLTKELVIGVLYNANKSNYWFSVEERIELIKESLIEAGISLENIKIISFNGLLVDLIEKENIDLLIRGLRAVSDYEYEVQLNLTNELLAKKKFETIFLNASRKYLYLSSSVVKEVCINNGELKFFVTDNVRKKMEDRVRKINGKAK
ncbi:pantetheine-phosphate adenylyltransferase [Oceanivirga miroungae]|uniref:Phosphopantetheine adenylyltransferase n=1 Tax=Oceanivirga miroungae TaxID=1130046 RepID=A0A6I8M7H0_9FUSO|nr:pantetheine-phosphate adenylyltransferase [Oceanivirga miroungae]VWL84770.1 lipopolysaccharide core biosynthesis protein [Oceanivirga miroungae]